MSSQNILLAVVSLAWLGVLAPTASATVDYNVTVDTSSALAQTGYIEFQFNPSGMGSQLAYASVLNFTTDGALVPPGTNTGDSSGQLPAEVSQDNGTSFNDYIEQVTFGTTINFDLLLSGPALDMPNGMGGGTFTLDFLNSDQSGYLFTADPSNDVPVLTVDINPDGTTTAMTYPSEDNGPPVVTFEGPTAIPEPATFGFVCVALAVTMVLCTISARRKSRRNPS